jgi:hypothetical protein
MVGARVALRVGLGWLVARDQADAARLLVGHGLVHGLAIDAHEDIDAMIAFAAARSTVRCNRLLLALRALRPV